MLIYRQVLVSFQDDDVFKIAYLNRIIEYFKNLFDDTKQSIPEMKVSYMSLSYDVKWRFIFEFLKLGIEFAEMRK